MLTLSPPPFFSIIIPVYNVENFLEKTVYSIITQDFTDFEILLINDGSTDSSEEICNQLAENDSRIRVFHKINEGVSVARNFGICKSIGKYIIFLDSDDMLVENCLIKIYKDIIINKDCELFLLNYYRLFPNGDLQKVELVNEFTDTITGIAFFKNHVKSDKKVPVSVWQYIFKSDFIKDNRLFFNKNLVIAEDGDFIYQSLIIAKKMKVLEEKMIYYRIFRDGSLTANINARKIESGLFVTSKFFYYFYNLITDKNQRNKICKYFGTRFANNVFRIALIKDKYEIKRLMHLVKENKIILNYTNGFLYKIAKLLWRIFGYYYGSLLMIRIHYPFNRNYK